MTTPAPQTRAWQPLTPRGIAAFVTASWRRLLVTQFIFGVLAGTAVAWFVHQAWFPAVTEAIRRLPEKGAIERGQLNWTGAAAQPLVDQHFLALAVDLDHRGQTRSPAHIQVEFGRTKLLIISLFGQLEQRYPADKAIAFNRVELVPWWGAWRPPILWLTFGATLLWCLASWTVLATIYAAPVWLAGFFANRDLSLRGSWKLSGAAMMPGAVAMIVGIVFYRLGTLDLIQLCAVFGLHLLIGWVFLFFGMLAAPRLASVSAAPANPFEESSGKPSDDPSTG